MNYENVKKQLQNKEISVLDLSCKDVKSITKKMKKELEEKQIELDELNEKIKDIKVRIDNFGETE